MIQMNKKTLLVSVIALIAVIAAVGGVVGYRFMQSKKASVPDLQSAANLADNLLGGATKGVLPGIGEATNPLTNKPDLNPADKANPFNAIKINPFE